MARDDLTNLILKDDNGGLGYAIVLDEDGNEHLAPMQNLRRETSKRQVNVGISVFHQPQGPATTIPGIPPQSLPQGIFRTAYEEPTPVEIILSGALVPINPAVPIGLNTIPVARIHWGCGGTFFTEIIDCSLPRGRLAVVAESLDVAVYALSVDAIAISANVNIQFTGMICQGINPDFLTNTEFSYQAQLPLEQGLGSGTSQIVSTSPVRLQSVTAYDFAGAGAEVLMLFDNVVLPSGGDIPQLSFPIPTFPGIVNADFLRSPHAFRNGLVWAISSNPYVFDSTGVHASRVDVETIR